MDVTFLVVNTIIATLAASCLYQMRLHLYKSRKLKNECQTILESIRTAHNTNADALHAAIQKIQDHDVALGMLKRK